MDTPHPVHFIFMPKQDKRRVTGMCWDDPRNHYRYHIDTGVTYDEYNRVVPPHVFSNFHATYRQHPRDQFVLPPAGDHPDWVYDRTRNVWVTNVNSPSEMFGERHFDPNRQMIQIINPVTKGVAGEVSPDLFLWWYQAALAADAADEERKRAAGWRQYTSLTCEGCGGYRFANVPDWINHTQLCDKYHKVAP